MKLPSKLILSAAFLLAACHSKSVSHTKKPEQRSTATQPPLVYQTYGLPALYHDKAMHEVLARYGVRLQAVAGCVVTDSLLKSVARNNEALFARLDKSLGPGSRDRIIAEAEGVAKTQRKVEEILRKTKALRQKEALLAKDETGGSITCSVKATGDAGMFDVAAGVLHYNSGSWQRSAWAAFRVDTASGDVQVLH